MKPIEHHPETASLAAYAAGALPAALALVVGCHLEKCSRCRDIVDGAEDVGGALLDELQPTTLRAGACEDLLRRLDDDAGQQPVPTSARVTGSEGPGPNAHLPERLRRLLGSKALAEHKWRTAGPGARMLSLDCKEGNALLLHVGAGRAMPVHSHRGTELTMILDGYYDDCLGRFGPGDVADLDASTEHQPVAGGGGCLCLAGLDAPLRFKGWLPRLLQPMIGL